MADVLLLHHAQGQTPGFLAFADALRAAGHTVHAPDLYAGQSFATLDEGMANAAVDRLRHPARAGRRSGRGSARRTSSTPASRSASWPRSGSPRPGRARAAPSCSTRRSRSASSPPAGRTGVPVQIHGGEADEFFMDEGDVDAARAVVAAAEDGELFTLPRVRPPLRRRQHDGLRPGGRRARAAARARLPRQGLTVRRRVVRLGPSPGQGVVDLVGPGAVRVGQSTAEPPLGPEAGPGGRLAGGDVADLVPELEPGEARLLERPPRRRAAARGW